MSGRFRASVRKRVVGMRDWLSFSNSVRELVDALNREIESPDKLRHRLQSHPSGFIRAITWRRLTMAEAYLKLVASKGAANYEERLDALTVLMHQAWHAKTLSMPINTARCQIALMKECVQSQGELRRQLELMSDFTRASYGQETVIRRLLRELDLIEVPEEGKPLKDLGLGFDDHVHDMMSQGTKTPSQLCVDAFIKGMSRLTVAYYDLEDPRMYTEALEAGRILGIQVEIGLEFSVGERGKRLHFMYVPPQDGSASSISSLVERNADLFKPFVDGLAHNARGRHQAICALLDVFNSSHLPELNSRFRNAQFLRIKPLTWADVEETIHGGQASHIHLGQLLAERLKPIFHKRVLYLKNQYEHSRNRLLRGEVSSWEVESIHSEYLKARDDYEHCRPETMTERYVTPSRRLADYDSAFPSLDVVEPLMTQVGGRLVFIHPLSQGPKRAVNKLLRAHHLITDIETFNMSDSLFRDPADLRRLNHLVELMNRGDEKEVRRLLADWGLPDIDVAQVGRAVSHYRVSNLRPRCGSDYIGSIASLPGMGFIDSRAIPKRALKQLESHGHASIPVPVAKLLLQGGDPDAEVEAEGQVVALSIPKVPKPNPVGDEVGGTSIGPMRFWRFLNPSLKGLLKTMIAYTPAFFVVGPWYAALWIGITGFRNLLADLISASGFMLKAWRWDNVDKENLANSMFWTGFSVPILGGAKAGFDYLWPHISGDATGFVYTLVQFWVIAFANGLYITSHNRIRGFDRRVIRANFFRTVLSWPLATAGSYLLNLLMIPPIVQSKIWSDTVAGIIEGTGKFMSRMRLRQRDFLELFTNLLSADRDGSVVATSDIMYVWARRDRGRSALANLLKGRIPPSVNVPASSEYTAHEVVVDSHQLLLRTLGAEGSMEMLTSKVLRNYSGREAVILTQFIGDMHEPFEAWLERHPPSERLVKTVEQQRRERQQVSEEGATAAAS